MNERVKELAKQAGAEFYEGFAGSPNSVKFMEEDFKKFAELIVRRVISVYNDTETFKTSTYDDKRVLEYFGVEEEKG